MDTITKIIEKIKKTRDTRLVYTLSVLLLFSLFMFSSFVFGRMSVLSENKPQNQESIQIYLPDGTLYTKDTQKDSISPLSGYIMGAIDNTSKIEETSAKDRIRALEEDPSASSAQVFGSKSGKVYYTENCKAGERVKKENRVYFDTTDQAEEEGYTQSKLCK